MSGHEPEIVIPNRPVAVPPMLFIAPKLPELSSIVVFGSFSSIINNIELKDEHYSNVFNTMPERTRKNNILSFELGKTLFRDFKERLA